MCDLGQVHAFGRQCPRWWSFSRTTLGLLTAAGLWLGNAPAATGATNADPGAAAVQSEPSNAGPVAAARLGELGDLQRLAFSGAKTFSAEALRGGLKNTYDFLEVSHPLASEAEYLHAIERKLRLGYQHLGFPGARITAQPDPKAGLIRVQVEEGPRFVCGTVTVRGVKLDLAQAIINRLTRKRPDAAWPQRAFDFVNHAPAEALPEEPKAPGQVDALWLRGQPAHFSEYDQNWLEWQVADELRNAGFFFPEFEVVIEPHAATQMADLRVAVQAEGPRRYVDRVEIVGNKKNSREALLRYLEVTPGMELTRQRLAEMADRLWHAARFLDFHLAVDAPNAAKQVGLTISVVEYAEAPPLEQRFSAMEEALLNSRQWLAKLNDRQEDILVDISGYPTASTGLELLLSPGGDVALVETSNQRQSSKPAPGGLLIKPESVALYAPELGRKLVVPCSGVRFKTFIQASGSATEGTDKPFNLTMGWNFNSDSEITRVPSCLELKLAPVFFVGLAHQKDSLCWFEGGWLICSNADWMLKSEAKTGRIVEFTIRQQGQGALSGRLRFQKGSFRREAQWIERAGTKLAEAYRTNAPLSSSLGFLAEGLLQSKLLPPLFGAKVAAETWARLPALAHTLKLSDTLAPLDQLLRPGTRSAAWKEGFVVPEVRDNPNGPFAWLANWCFPAAEELFPVSSWPGRLLREAALVLQDRTQYTTPALQTLYNSPELGPLGCWTIASLLALEHQPALARDFSARGLARLSAAEFRNDCRALGDSRAIVGQCLENLATVLRNMREEDWQRLQGTLPPSMEIFLRDANGCLGQAKGPASCEALAPALNKLWDTELRQKVARELGELKENTQ